MRRLTITTLCRVAAFAGALLLLSACRDDALGVDSSATCEAGLPAEVTLKVQLPELDRQTRSVIDEEGGSYVRDLWLGIFAEDGTCTTNTIYDLSSTKESVGSYYDIENLRVKTRSGKSRIVAVANAQNHMGLKNATTSFSDRKNLGTLLTEVQTWDDFKNLVAVRSDSLEYDWYTYDMVMSGYYCSPDDAGSALVDSIPAVLIYPDENDLSTGAIRLRHVMAYNKFRIRQSDSRMKVTLKSWQICNLPSKGLVAEGSTNAANDVSTQNFNTTDLSTVFEPDEDDFNWKTFDFYQFESKHNATANNGSTGEYTGIRKDVSTDEMYADREREYKNASDGTNTGVYRSLVPTNDPTSLLNAATYVVIKADIDYYIANTAENIADPIHAEPVDYGTSGAIHRIAEATYTIHLGYCEGKEQGKATYKTACDFNCRRNTYYTYNVTIAGVTNIIVEALSSTGEEPQSGAEGTVEDIYDIYYDLDAHYNTFNIRLTNYQRNHMSWRISAPFNTDSYSIRSADYTTADALTALKENPLYTWIKFKPAPDRETLAVYKTSADDETQWTVDQLVDPAHYPHTATNTPTDLNDSTVGLWYTVFVDEYVYHQFPDGTHKEAEGGPETLWYAYINADPRSLELLSGDTYTSADKESTFVHTLYAISQRSIQTFYKDLNEDGASEEGFGLEHYNESYGLNMRWNTTIADASLSAYNGRYNEWQIVKALDGNLRWDSFVDFTERDSIIGGTFTSPNESYMHLYFDATVHTVPQLKTISQMGGSASICVNDPVQNDARIFYANIACLNRNRDENGNGIIDKEEVKWFLPTYSCYAYAALGENALVHPLINYYEYPRTYYSMQYNTTNCNGRQNFHYIGSDRTYLWAEEALSRGTGAYSNTTKTYEGTFPFNLRCARNLGSSLSKEPNDPAREVTLPYEIDDETRIFTATYFQSSCIRPSVDGYLAPHTIADGANRLPKQFQLAKTYLVNTTADTYLTDEYGIYKVDKSGYLANVMTASSYSNYTGLRQTQVWEESASVNSLCKLYTQEPDGSDLGTWRLPNWKELALLAITKYVVGNYTDKGTLGCTHEYFISYPGVPAEGRYFGVAENGNITRNVFKRTWLECPMKIRCVRDVM